MQGIIAQVTFPCEDYPTVLIVTLRWRSQRKRRRPRRPGASPLAAYAPVDLPDQQTLVRGMVEMESLAEEPEFDDFKLGEDAFEIAAKWKPSPRLSLRLLGWTFAAVWSN